MPTAALVFALLGGALLALPVLLRVPLDLLAPFVAPLGGAACVVAGVLAVYAVRRRRRGTPGRRLAWASFALSLAGVASAISVEQTLIQRDRADQLRRAAPASVQQRQAHDKQFQNDFDDNLTR